MNPTSLILHFQVLFEEKLVLILKLGQFHDILFSTDGEIAEARKEEERSQSMVSVITILRSCDLQSVDTYVRNLLLITEF